MCRKAESHLQHLAHRPVRKTNPHIKRPLLHTYTLFSSCVWSSQTSPRPTMDSRAHPCHLQYFFYSAGSVRLSAGCQRAWLLGKQLRLLPIVKYAFKMSLAPERAKAEATNRFTLVVQLTLARTWLLLSLCLAPKLSVFLFIPFFPLFCTEPHFPLKRNKMAHLCQKFYFSSTEKWWD